MWIIQIVRCAFGRHRRDRKTMVINGPVKYATCRGCRKRLVKQGGYWRSDRGDAQIDVRAVPTESP